MVKFFNRRLNNDLHGEYIAMFGSKLLYCPCMHWQLLDGRGRANDIYLLSVELKVFFLLKSCLCLCCLVLMQLRFDVKRDVLDIL